MKHIKHLSDGRDWSGYLTVENGAAVAERLRSMIGAGQRYTWVAVNELFGHRPEVRTSQVAKEIALSFSGPYEDGHRGVHISIPDSYGVWGLHTTAADAGDARGRCDKRDRVWLSFTRRALAVDHYAPGGNHMFWTIALEDRADLDEMQARIDSAYEAFVDMAQANGGLSRSAERLSQISRIMSSLTGYETPQRVAYNRVWDEVQRFKADAKHWHDTYQQHAASVDEFLGELLEMLPGAADIGSDAYDQIPRGIEELRADRDRARAIAVALEQECAEVADALADVDGHREVTEP